MIFDDETKFAAMIALPDVDMKSAEIWVDHRICGISQAQLALREGVSRNRINQRVIKADRVIGRFMGRSE